MDYPMSHYFIGVLEQVEQFGWHCGVVKQLSVGFWVYAVENLLVVKVLLFSQVFHSEDCSTMMRKVAISMINSVRFRHACLKERVCGIFHFLSRILLNTLSGTNSSINPLSWHSCWGLLAWWDSPPSSQLGVINHLFLPYCRSCLACLNSYTPLHFCRSLYSLFVPWPLKLLFVHR